MFAPTTPSGLRRARGLSLRFPRPAFPFPTNYLENVKPAGRSFSLVSAGTNARSVIV